MYYEFTCLVELSLSNNVDNNVPEIKKRSEYKAASGKGAASQGYQQCSFRRELFLTRSMSTLTTNKENSQRAKKILDHSKTFN